MYFLSFQFYLCYKRCEKSEKCLIKKRICRGESSQKYGISDINLVKPSIGEATRVLLRRVPWKVLVHSLDDNEHLGHLYQLAAEKNVELEVYPLKNYRACGLIKNLADN